SARLACERYWDRCPGTPSTPRAAVALFYPPRCAPFLVQSNCNAHHPLHADVRRGSTPTTPAWPPHLHLGKRGAPPSQAPKLPS
ncbi:hypothetical protein ACTXT7_016679, partial [Hymenolepis weldensis]